MVTPRSFHLRSRPKNAHGSWSSTNSATIRLRTRPTTPQCLTGSSSSAANIPPSSWRYGRSYTGEPGAACAISGITTRYGMLLSSSMGAHELTPHHHEVDLPLLFL